MHLLSWRAPALVIRRPWELCFAARVTVDSDESTLHDLRIRLAMIGTQSAPPAPIASMDGG